MAESRSKTVLVLDAMGVLYPMGEDIDNLLVPFIAESGGSRDPKHIRALYTQASLGKLGTRELWEGVGLDLSYEDRFLSHFDLTPGLLDFLAQAQQHFASIAYLSNDVSDWARKRADRFGLSRFFSEWIVSGDVGLRKPGAEIYLLLLARLKVEPHHVLFVDDRVRNLDAARAVGIRTVLYPALGAANAAGHLEATGLVDVLAFAERS